MKRYRLHDLLRAAALAYAATACSQPTTNTPPATDVVGDDTPGDSQVTPDAADTAGDAALDVAADVVPDSVLTDTTPDIAADAQADTALDAGPDVAADVPSDTATTFKFPCTGSTPILQNGQVTGYETCSGGLVHRAEAKACPAYVPDPNKICAIGGACKTDADCAGTKGGHCDTGMDSPCYCQSSCETDADCGTGQICQCGAKFGSCVQAACTSDHDCQDGMVCGFYVANPGCNFPAFACQTGVDSCAVKADCAAQEECTWDATTGHRFCSAATCAIGRPFEVAGDWRTAGVTARDDWGGATADSQAQLDPLMRALLAEYWLEAAQMEHASVASFARLTLELMAVGAPPELLTQAQQAGIDEVRHAQACFGLAASFGAAAQGPGVLAIDAALRQPDLLTIAAAAAREGCVWETCAALEARVAAQACEIPKVRAALAAIADDEANHADLAWAIVRWALQSGGDDVRFAVNAALDEATTELLARPCGKSLPAGLGVLRGAELQRLRQHAVAAVIVPARQRLLA